MGCDYGANHGELEERLQFVNVKVVEQVNISAHLDARHIKEPRYGFSGFDKQLGIIVGPR